ncbi:hypothetical protein MSBR3_0865 [Methanosarcina barkeri 3]|uniref:Histidine kinase domain-containing protein n=1 Tax=Methanosarcina barkeri 3 TaxID=1434107 RepID=A0A0E3SL69_METBA|nr:sensor histidine kinase [Methanosarcina barkeri]AKB81443.1 hypothetical protein MSBR3_0865 [Methanosarcina barkeri 3]
MTRIPFKVSARTARLIGRENVANAEGAIIELVKNCYDADAYNCILFFDNKYHLPPSILAKEEYLILSGFSDSIDLFYTQDINGNYLLNDNSYKDTEKLNSFFSNFCHLYIIDNGSGMTEKVIQDHWMTIGTDNKNTQYETKNGRIKTGEKGIGRFALDRLGKSCEIYTLPEQEKEGFLWQVNWSDFESPGLTIDKVEAELTPVENLDLKEKIIDLTQNYEPLSKVLNDINFKSGTIIKINKLTDEWDEHLVERIFKSLEILVPPKEIPIFSIYLFSSLQENEYGEISSEFCDDFDYKVFARHLDDHSKTVILEIERNELDVDLIEKEYIGVFKQEGMKKSPYDFKTLKEKKFTIETTLAKLVPGFKDNDAKRILDKIGEFSFTFYFLKNVSSAEDSRYPYKSFSSASRKQWLNKFGGVKIFRDGFLVRPYGLGKNDWLGLGERAGISPGGAGQKRTGWRIRPNQISGSISISRVANSSFQDKSGREGIQENDAFNLFKNIIIGIIEEFEDDRINIMYSFNQFHSLRNDKESTKEKAEEFASKRIEIKKIKQISRKYFPDSDTDASKGISIVPKALKGNEFVKLEKEAEVLAEGYEIQKQELEEKEEELRLIRSLASSGLIVATFTHELKHIRTQFGKRTTYLRKYLHEQLETSKLEGLPAHENPFILIDKIEEQDNKLIKWINFSILMIKKDRRKRRDIDINEYFIAFKKTWWSFLLDRKVTLNLDPQVEKCSLKAYDIDFDSIFSNLIVNSVEAFQREGSSKERIIEIKWEVIDKSVTVLYKDTGCGLSQDYRDNPEIIFKAFETTKKDRSGNVIGTGLGMWLVKNIVDEYSGNIKILKPESGFMLQIVFPLSKQKK